jgi:hypothetical protein
MTETETGTIVPIAEISRRMGHQLQWERDELAHLLEELAAHRPTALARSKDCWKGLSMVVRKYADDAWLRGAALAVMGPIAEVGAGLGAWVAVVAADRAVAVAALEDERSPARTVAHACTLLRFIQTRVSTSAGVICPPRLVIRAMRHYTRDKAVQVAACRVIAAWQTPDDDDDFVALRVLDAIVVGVLRQFGETDEGAACDAVSALAGLMIAAPAKFAGQITPDIVGAVTAAMQQFPDNVWLLESACSFLWSVATSSPANRPLVAKSGGLAALLAVMRAHSSLSRVLMKALGALSNLLKLFETAEMFMASGGIAALEAVMAANRDDGGVQHYGATVVWILALNTRIERKSLGPCIPMLKRALAAHPTHTQVVSASCGSIWKIAEAIPPLIRLIGSDGAALVASVAR